MAFSRSTARTSYPDRLATFQGYWDDNEATARQLAAYGHVCDRPPIEAYEEGSHCSQCSAFVHREDSVRAFEGPLYPYARNDSKETKLPILHHPNCLYLQIKIPLDHRTALTGGSLGSFRSTRDLWESRTNSTGTNALTHTLTPTSRQAQSSSLFSLPTELRLQIYSLILPTLAPTTTIFQLHKDSTRIITQAGAERSAPRDATRCNLLATCHAVHSEALSLLFATTTYKFYSTKLLYLFLRHIGPRGRSLLRGVDVCCGQREDAVAFALLASCEQVRALTIRLSRPVLLFPRPPPWTHDGVACLLALRGVESVEFGECQGNYLDEEKADAAVVRREVSRARGEEGGVRWVDGWLDL